MWVNKTADWLWRCSRMVTLLVFRPCGFLLFPLLFAPPPYVCLFSLGALCVRQLGVASWICCSLQSPYTPAAEHRTRSTHHSLFWYQHDVQAQFVTCVFFVILLFLHFRSIPLPPASCLLPCSAPASSCQLGFCLTAQLCGFLWTHRHHYSARLSLQPLEPVLLHTPH